MAWRFLAEGPLELESNFLLGHRAESKYPSHKMCCYIKLMQADNGRGGILYVYPKKSCMGHYTVVSFLNITVKEPWVATSEAIFDLILDFEPVQFIAADAGSRDMWLNAFRDLERAQHERSSVSPSKSLTRISADELAGVDVAVHHGEHVHFPSPHREPKGDSISSHLDSSPASRLTDTVEMNPQPSTPVANGEAEFIILNNRYKWEISSALPRDPLVVISDLIHTIQSLYGVTKEGQRVDISDDVEEDEWHAVADSQMFSHFIVATSELQTVDLSGLDSQDMSKFFISTYSLLSMHAAGVLKLTLQEVLDEYTVKVGYVIDDRVYTLAEVIDLCS